ncbi:MAG: hypothetical protein AB8G18_11595 [Gammaproteobacteria bacterium]
MNKPKNDNISLAVSVAGTTTYEGDIVAYVFAGDGSCVDRVTVKNGKVSLPFSATEARKRQVFFGPELDQDTPPTLQTLRRISAFEAVLTPGDLVDRIVIPGTIISLWPFCLCWVTGRVLKNGRPVCDAIVHICEVDPRRWLFTLPDLELFRLRDDLIDILREPPTLSPPDPRPGPRNGPAPDFRTLDTDFNLDNVTFASSRITPRKVVASREALSRPIDTLAGNVLTGLGSNSTTLLRSTLVDNFYLLYPYFCFTPFWWRYRCDEITTRTTGADGRFNVLVPYNCSGDKPDIYVWVEYPINGTNQTVYRPPIACNTYWNYVCGSQITINITDPRVPTCDPEFDSSSCQVAVMSIGPGVSVDEIEANGLTSGGAPFGSTLEPRVDFSRTGLIAKGITHYLWSFRRLTDPDGVSPNVGAWQPMDRDVYRHYRVLTGGVLSYPSYQLGPDAAGPAPNTFQIKPPAPPAPGIEWTTLNERVDLASAYFETRKLPGAPATRADGDDSSAGMYELKLELFKAGSANPIEWEPEGVSLRVPDIAAPFPTGTVTTTNAPESRRIRNPVGNTIAFRMVLRVDNNFCQAQVFAASGSSVDCGIIEASPGSTVELGFRARHPNGFATYSHSVERGDGNNVAIAATSGTAGSADAAGFIQAPPFEYRKSFTAGDFLTGTTCTQAAFAEVIDVDATGTNGYSRLSGYDQTDIGAFALVEPCEECEECPPVKPQG